MNTDDLAKLEEIHRLLDEAYRYYFEHGDGHCKSSEGHVSVEFGNYWERQDKGLHVTGVSVYSYVLGPNRTHDFDSLDQALEVVRSWHRQEVNTVYDDDRYAIDRPEGEGLYESIEVKRRADMEAQFAEWDRMVAAA